MIHHVPVFWCSCWSCLSECRSELELRKCVNRLAPALTNGTRISWRKELVWAHVGVTVTMIEAMIASMAMMRTRRQRWAW